MSKKPLLLGMMAVLTLALLAGCASSNPIAIATPQITVTVKPTASPTMQPSPSLEPSVSPSLSPSASPGASPAVGSVP
jgi:predicted component of type VI protein secretion system